MACFATYEDYELFNIIDGEAKFCFSETDIKSLKGNGLTCIQDIASYSYAARLDLFEDAPETYYLYQQRLEELFPYDGYDGETTETDEEILAPIPPPPPAPTAPKRKRTYPCASRRRRKRTTPPPVPKCWWCKVEGLPLRNRDELCDYCAETHEDAGKSHKACERCYIHAKCACCTHKFGAVRL